MTLAAHVRGIMQTILVLYFCKTLNVIKENLYGVTKYTNSCWQLSTFYHIHHGHQKHFGGAMLCFCNVPGLPSISRELRQGGVSRSR